MAVDKPHHYRPAAGRYAIPAERYLRTGIYGQESVRLRNRICRITRFRIVPAQCEGRHHGQRESACGETHQNRVMGAVAAVTHDERLYLAGLQPGPER